VACCCGPSNQIVPTGCWSITDTRYEPDELEVADGERVVLVAANYTPALATVSTDADLVAFVHVGQLRVADASIDETAFRQACPFVAADTPPDAFAGVAAVRITVIDMGADAEATFAAWQARQSDAAACDPVRAVPGHRDHQCCRRPSGRGSGRPARAHHRRSSLVGPFGRDGVGANDPTAGSRKGAAWVWKGGVANTG
jgi:hypothetical protein